jgi:hypothetical protein
MMERVHSTIAYIEPADSVERYTELGVDVRKGYARIIDPWTVEIDGKERITGRSIVIAAGGEPFVPDLPGLEEAGYLTSDTMWDALRGRDEMPRRIAILGGGPIGTEMAQSFARLGAKVTQVEHGDRLLSKEDPEVSELVAARLRSEGVELMTGHKAVRCEGKVLVAEGPGGEVRIPFDELIVAWAARHGSPAMASKSSASRPERRSSPTTISRRSTPTYSPSATWRDPISSPIRGAPGLVRGGERAVRHLQEVQHRLFRASLGDLHRSRSRPCRPQRDQRQGRRHRLRDRPLRPQPSRPRR